MSVQAASARPQASPRRPPAKPPPSTQAGRYTGLFDCFSKISKAEGLGALYRGLPANVIGIMPEKTIKLAGNDFFRHYFQASPCPAPCTALVPQSVPRAPGARRRPRCPTAAPGIQKAWLHAVCGPLLRLRLRLGWRRGGCAEQR